MTFRIHLALSLMALSSSTCVLAQANAAQGDYAVAFNVGAVTDYRFRGIAQTSTNPALQAGIDVAHKSGLYLGAWGSNISWIKDYLGATDGSLEVDLYGGYKGAISKDVSFDVGLIAYQYPGNTSDRVSVNANTTELYGALSYGPVTLKYSRSSANFVANANSAGSAYLEMAATFDLGSGFSLTPHVGHQTIPNLVASPGDYSDYSITLGKDLGNGLTATLAALGSNANKTFYTGANAQYLGNSALVAGLKYSF